jgi:Tfp pilus assembly protein PilX
MKRFPYRTLAPLQNPRVARVSREKGFALVVTVTLMVLITLIALAMLSLSSVMIRKSSVDVPMEQARSNARMALMMALGQLQKHAGPDQRVTATADIAGDTNGVTLPAGTAPKNLTTITGAQKGLSQLVPGSRHWTGVWRNASTPTQIYTRTPAPALVSWLISGTENETTPTLTPNLPDATVSASGEPSNPEKAVVLVGPQSAGTTTADNFVAAPLVKIAPHTGSTLSGRYAWWIGDEGVKARIDIKSTNTDNTDYASLVAQRRGWETVTGLSSYPSPGNPGHENLPNLITSSQASLIPGTNPIATKEIFHAATSDSRGVISDTLNGGTRVDLTTLLESGIPSTNPFPTIPTYPTATTTIIPRTVGRSLLAPRWTVLKDFYDRYSTLENGDLIVKGAIMGNNPSNNPNVLPGVTANAIAPIVTDFRILMGVRFVNQGTGVKTNPCGKIAIAIANPYSVPLRWNQDLELYVKNQTPAGNLPSRIWDLGAETAILTASNEPAVFNNAYFRIRADTLQPGEVRAYTHSGRTFRDRSNRRVTIDLTPFATSSPTSFSNCIEMDTTLVRTTLPGLDIRESWQTTLVGLEMRLGAGSGGNLLRAIDRFEIDNGYFSPNVRRFNIEETRQITEPVPLMLYSFQISQPGADYLSVMPNGYEPGQRASTLRTFMDFNLQATRIYKPIASYNPPPYFMESTNGFSELPANPPGGQTGPGFTRNLALPKWGYSPVSGSGKAILFDVPNRFVSLAQLQHADLTGDDVSTSVGHQPAYAVGNSYASPFVKRSLTFQSRFDYEITGSPNPSGATPTSRNYYDLSYLLNASLWDTYFFSSLTGSGTSRKPANPTLIYHKGESNGNFTNPTEPAAALMIDGSFNINSTSKDAWKAFLASGRSFKHKADATDRTGAAFPRSLNQLTSSNAQPTGTAEDSYTGYRRLTDSELDALATEIVKQVRLRGPFVSLSHFVNRAIGDLTDRTTPVNVAMTRSGALQGAIDESGATINFAGTRTAFASITAARDILNLSEKQGAPRADLDGGDTSNQLPNADPSIPDWAVTSTDNNFGSVASIIADRTMLSNPTRKREQGYRSTGIPGWLTQADILQVIGSAISARSDTFRIRTCGEAVDADGKVIARAYCEAIVQRIPDYIDPSDEPTERGTQLNALNTTYGRQFKVVSFRWLSNREI